MGRTGSDVTIIGAGVAGLTAAAIFALDGARVTIVEHHAVAGGCASFYQKNGYRFDVGATVAGGFGKRGIHERLFRALGVELDAQRVEPSMAVHIGDERIVRYGDARWRTERLRAFGASGEAFWRVQERIADLAWDFAARMPAMPDTVRGARALLGAFRLEDLALLPYIGKSASALLPRGSDPRLDLLRRFVDAQLLITAQANAAHTDALYAATALDLAREGVVHLPGGMSDISIALARALRKRGATIRYKTTAREILLDARGRVRGVATDRGEILGDRVIAALPAADVLSLLPNGSAPELARRVVAAPQRWGAFTVYAGIAPGEEDAERILHHQLVEPEGPMGEGRSLFVSFASSRERARNGGSAVTISTHTDVATWERAQHDGTYEERKNDLGRRMLAVLDRVAPGMRDRVDFTEFATPLTFARYTARNRGFVGGLPAATLRATLFGGSARSGVEGLALCGDTAFPGQSTVGAALSGVNAAATRVSRRSVREIFAFR